MAGGIRGAASGRHDDERRTEEYGRHMMRPWTWRWRGLAVLALALLMAGCGGSSSAQGPAATGTKGGSAGRAATTGISTVTFTASGGLTGQIALSMNLNTTGSGDLISYHLAS